MPVNLVFVQTRVPPHVLQACSAWARDEYMSTAALVRKLLCQAVEQRQREQAQKRPAKKRRPRS